MLAVSIKNLQQNTWKLLLPALLQKWAHICIEMQNLWKIADFRRAMDKLQAEIDDAEKKLATSTEMEPVERHTLQDQVDVMKREWEQMSMSEERYLVSGKRFEAVS